ncbi:MAG: hypothetical protein MZV63_55800 [Marinilabiliales bacterium]|nr:hypothetical protein [Marinilabiliales bacterium]
MKRTGNGGHTAQPAHSGPPQTAPLTTAGGTIPGGGYVRIYNGSGTAFSRGYYLEPGTLYYYRAWSVGSGNTLHSPCNYLCHNILWCASCLPHHRKTSLPLPIKLPNCWSEDISGQVLFNPGDETLRQVPEAPPGKCGRPGRPVHRGHSRN